MHLNKYGELSGGCWRFFLCYNPKYVEVKSVVIECRDYIPRYTATKLWEIKTHSFFSLYTTTPRLLLTRLLERYGDIDVRIREPGKLFNYHVPSIRRLLSGADVECDVELDGRRLGRITLNSTFLKPLDDKIVLDD
jgi:hypothetical protein